VFSGSEHGIDLAGIGENRAGWHCEIKGPSTGQFCSPAFAPNSRAKAYVIWNVSPKVVLGCE